jgi:hypothetical protein
MEPPRVQGVVAEFPLSASTRNIASGSHEVQLEEFRSSPPPQFPCSVFNTKTNLDEILVIYTTEHLVS